MSADRAQRWLILSHAFNMDGRASSQTITDKIPHILNAGVEVVVLSGVSGLRDAHLEHHQLWPLGPAGIKFELRHVLRRKWGHGLAYRIGMTLASVLLLPGIFLEKLFRPVESSWSWYLTAYLKGLLLIRAGRFDMIYSTGGAFAAHLAAQALSRRTGLPWMAEVHDPFVTPGQPVRSAQARMQCKVEKIICTEASLAVWFTDQALASAKARHPQLGARGKVLLPGIDQPFVAGLPARTASSKLILGHFGSLSETRNLVRIVEAFEHLRVHAPEVLQDIELHIYGGPLDVISAKRIQASASRSHFRHFGRVEADPESGLTGRERILQKMRSVDVLLLLHGEEPICEEYIPSKMYEYLWMQRPILAQVHRNPQMTAMIKTQGHQVVETGLHVETAHEVGREMADALTTLWHAWKLTALPDNGRQSPLTTKATVDQLLAMTENLLRSR
jgi:glycosyltransferase involved in cell wall biosynthesis